MNLRALKYLLAYTLPFSVFLSFQREGWYTFMPLIYGFGIIPFLELFIKASPKNLDKVGQEMASKSRLYDWLVWLLVPVQLAILIWYFFNIQTVEAFGISWWGRTISMGMMCGVLGINVAHELGHRRANFEQVLSKILLMTTLYPHFFIEHNQGHHKNVATKEDPASAKLNESLYGFWLRSVFYSYLSAWKIEKERFTRQKIAAFTLHNQMLVFTLLEAAMLLTIFLLFGKLVLLGFLLASVFGILMLETVNYIEHYGLRRARVNGQRYEKTTPVHSWNSDHILGRLFLFELSRHSDHHAHPHKKYQVLQSYEESPQMPTGYPGMMLLSTIPPLWFWVMNGRLHRFAKNRATVENTLARNQGI